MEEKIAQGKGAKIPFYNGEIYSFIFFFFFSFLSTTFGFSPKKFNRSSFSYTIYFAPSKFGFPIWIIGKRLSPNQSSNGMFIFRFTVLAFKTFAGRKVEMGI